MRPTHSLDGKHPRRGVALVLVVVALATLTVVLSGVTFQIITNRRLAERRHYQLQAAELARAGIELAAGRLLEKDDYPGETIKLLPQSQVRIEVQADKATPGRFRVHSVARYPTDHPQPVVQSLTRSLRRRADGTGVRIEIEDEADGKVTARR